MGVPISVTRPPRIEPKESGIRTIAGERLARVADWIATGNKSDNAPMLFITVDNNAPRPVSVPTWSIGRRVAGARLRAKESTTPEFERPLLRIRTAITVIVAGCPKPTKASLAGTTPAATAKTSVLNATTS